MARGNMFNKITFSTRLLSELTYSQARSVAYHEIGHLIFQHSKKRSEFKGNQQELYQLCKQQEFTADSFSVYTDVKYKRHPQIINALYIIAPPYRYDKDSSTHPSVYKRAQNVNRILKEIKF